MRATDNFGLIYFLFKFTSIVLSSRTISRVDLLRAIKSSPELYRYEDGRLMTVIDGADGRGSKRLDENDYHMNPHLYIKSLIVAKSSSPQPRGYTRFGAKDLTQNMTKFKVLYKGSYYARKRSEYESLNLENQLAFVEKVLPEVLEMCRFVLRENNESKDSKAYIGRKREMLNFISGPDSHYFIRAIRRSESLSMKAMVMIDAHLFSFTAEFEMNLDIIDPSKIVELAFPTLKPMYALLVNMIATTNKSSPTYQIIKSYPLLVHKLFQLLYLPDALERKSATIALINLFGTQYSLRRQIISCLSCKYEEMKDLFSMDYSFIYNDILSIHRACFMLLEAEDEDDQDEEALQDLKSLFLKFTISLIKLPDLPAFADQWTFTFLEIAPHLSDSLKIFTDNSFSFDIPSPQFHRDSELIIIFETIMKEMSFKSQHWPILIRFLFQKTWGMIIRPALHELVLEKFFIKTGILWKFFNINNGKLMSEAQALSLTLFEINFGLRQLYISLCEFELDIPKSLGKAIYDWLGGLDMFYVIADGGLMPEELKLMKSKEAEYQDLLCSLSSSR